MKHKWLEDMYINQPISDRTIDCIDQYLISKSKLNKIKPIFKKDSIIKMNEFQKYFDEETNIFIDKITVENFAVQIQ